MKKIVRTFVVAMGAVVLFSSCASIFTPSSYPLVIQSNPEDASVVVMNQRGVEYARGVTPFTVTLKASDGFFSKAEYSVKFMKDGYEDRIIPVTFSIEGWYFGNILLGGLIGMLIIDPATGAMWKIDQDVITADLKPVHASLQILDINEISDEMKAKLVPVDVTGK